MSRRLTTYKKPGTVLEVHEEVRDGQVWKVTRLAEERREHVLWGLRTEARALRGNRPIIRRGHFE